MLLLKLALNMLTPPPHQASLNEAEKVANHIWASARAHMIYSQAPDMLFAKAVDFSIYNDFGTTTAASRGWLMG